MKLEMKDEAIQRKKSEGVNDPKMNEARAKILYKWPVQNC